MKPVSVLDGGLQEEVVPPCLPNSKEGPVEPLANHFASFDFLMDFEVRPIHCQCLGSQARLSALRLSRAKIAMIVVALCRGPSCPDAHQLYEKNPVA